MTMLVCVPPAQVDMLSAPDPLLCQQPAESDIGKDHVTFETSEGEGTSAEYAVAAALARYRPFLVVIAPLPYTWKAVPPVVWNATLEPVALDCITPVEVTFPNVTLLVVAMGCGVARVNVPAPNVTLISLEVPERFAPLTVVPLAA